MFSYWDEYKRKLKTSTEAVKVVKSGDYIDYGHLTESPLNSTRLLLNAGTN